MRDDKLRRPQVEDFEGDWNKWAAYVLNSIIELKYDIERIFDLLTSRDQRREQDCPFRHRIAELEKRVSEQAAAIHAVKLTIAKWSGAVIVINAIIIIIIQYIAATK